MTRGRRPSLREDTLTYWQISRAMYAPKDGIPTKLMTIGAICAQLGRIQSRMGPHHPLARLSEALLWQAINQEDPNDTAA